jgi:hypothetical protein
VTKFESAVKQFCWEIAQTLNYQPEFPQQHKQDVWDAYMKVEKSLVRPLWKKKKRKVKP